MLGAHVFVGYEPPLERLLVDLHGDQGLGHTVEVAPVSAHSDGIDFALGGLVYAAQGLDTVLLCKKDYSLSHGASQTDTHLSMRVEIVEQSQHPVDDD